MDRENIIELFYRRPTEEIVTRERLEQLIDEGRVLKHYIGFEISGLAHLGSGLSTYLKIKDLLETKIVKPTIFLADYHSWINNKLGGDLERIRRVALGYFKSVFLSFGLDESQVEFVLASKLYDDEYWKLVLSIGNNTTLSRVRRSLDIMGREESDSNPASFILYPLMQSADIFKLGVDIAHAGMDQRKVHMLAIDVAEKMDLKKPLAMHTHLLPSLKGQERMGPFAKMSKSIPDSAIFIHDGEDEIRKKIRKAHCPEKELEGNSVFEILKYLLHRRDDEEFTIERPEKFGGDITLTIPEFEKLYKEGKIHPLDLKNYVAEKLIKELERPRKYFEQHKELMEDIVITR